MRYLPLILLSVACSAGSEGSVYRSGPVTGDAGEAAVTPTAGTDAGGAAVSAAGTGGTGGALVAASGGVPTMPVAGSGGAPTPTAGTSSGGSLAGQGSAGTEQGGRPTAGTGGTAQAGTGGKPPACAPMPKYNTCSADQLAEFEYANTVKYSSSNAYTFKQLVAVYKSGAGYYFGGFYRCNLEVGCPAGWFPATNIEPTIGKPTWIRYFYDGCGGNSLTPYCSIEPYQECLSYQIGDVVSAPDQPGWIRTFTCNVPVGEASLCGEHTPTEGANYPLQKGELTYQPVWIDGGITSGQQCQ